MTYVLSLFTFLLIMLTTDYANFYSPIPFHFVNTKYFTKYPPEPIRHSYFHFSISSSSFNMDTKTFSHDSPRILPSKQSVFRYSSSFFACAFAVLRCMVNSVKEFLHFPYSFLVNIHPLSTMYLLIPTKNL